MRKALLKYIAVVIATAGLCAAEVLGTHPFGAGFCAALLYLRQPALVVFPAYLVFSLLFDFSLSMVVYTLAVIGTSFLAALLSLRFKRAKNALFGAFFALSQCVLFFFMREKAAARIVLHIAVAVLAYLASICFLTPVLVKKLAYELLETEIICGAALLLFFAYGASAVHPAGFNFAYLIGAFAVTLCARLNKSALTVGVSLCFGGGIALFARPDAVAYWTFAAFVCTLFSAAPRPVPQLSFCTGFVLFAYLFSPPSWQSMVCLCVGALLSALLPRASVKRWQTLLFGRFTRDAACGIIDRSARNTGRELVSASHIFTDMQSAMENVPTVGEDYNTLEQGVCAHCFKYAECNAYKGFRESLCTLEERSAEKGHASVSDLPPLLTASCENLTALIAGAGKSAEERHEQLLVRRAKAEGRKLVAAQLGLMANVLKSVGERVSLPSQRNEDAEEKICTELRYRGVAAPEAIVAGTAVAVVVKMEEGGLTQEEAANVIARVCHAPYEIVHGGADVLQGYALWQFVRAPRFDVAFSAAGSALAARSGDSHTFVYLGGNRFMMALCDGMGSGDEAEKASETAIELIENFFKAGMDSMSAVSCVNRFLAQTGVERFSTLDVTVIDLNSGVAELIKLSSPPTVIKSPSGVVAVPCAALPMGVMEEIHVGREVKNLRAGDEVIMATDGVSDALTSDENLIEAARTLSDEPQSAANELLAIAERAQNGKLRDDATVLCARLFERG